jgi:hypothetical protein
MSETCGLGLAKIGKAYRILLSPLVGTPHRCIPAGDAAMRRSELDGPALRYFNQQMLIHELIRGSLGQGMRYLEFIHLAFILINGIQACRWMTMQRSLLPATTATTATAATGGSSGRAGR